MFRILSLESGLLLTAQKECIDNVKFIMENLLKPEVKIIEQEGLELPKGLVQVKIIRSMLDGKMCGILSGAGRAHCQLCAASLKYLKDIEMVRAGLKFRNAKFEISILCLPIITFGS